VSLDRNYVDDRRFPPDESGGVVVLSAPGERAFRKLLRQLHEMVFGYESSANGGTVERPLPLLGLKLEVDPGWRESETGGLGRKRPQPTSDP